MRRASSHSSMPRSNRKRVHASSSLLAPPSTRAPSTSDQDGAPASCRRTSTVSMAACQSPFTSICSATMSRISRLSASVMGDSRVGCFCCTQNGMRMSKRARSPNSKSGSLCHSTRGSGSPMLSVRA